MSSGPSFPSQRSGGSGASNQQGFGPSGASSDWGRDPYAPYTSYANAPPLSAAQERAPRGLYGDSANEYLAMKRGRYDAWVHVVFAFLMEIGVLGFVPGMIVGFIADAIGVGSEMTTYSSIGIGGVVGLVGAYFVFRDRWRCIEAFSSRFCAGVANISILYVPFIALVYANVRGLRKLAGQ